MSFEPDEATKFWIGFSRLSGWMTRSRDAIVADLKGVDCGSLDVLLYCADDVAVGTPGDWMLTGPADLA